MKEWGFAQTHVSVELAQLHYFSMKKHQAGAEIEFLITVKEFITPQEPTMHFFAQADKETNQKTAPYRPCGWGRRCWKLRPSVCARFTDSRTTGRRVGLRKNHRRSKKAANRLLAR